MRIGTECSGICALSAALDRLTFFEKRFMKVWSPRGGVWWVFWLTYWFFLQGTQSNVKKTIRYSLLKPRAGAEGRGWEDRGARGNSGL